MLLSPLFGAASATTVQTIVAEADASVAEAHPDRNFGDTTSLRVDGTSPVTNAYFRFNLSAVTSSIERATIRVYVENGSRTGFDIHAVANSSWDESRLTWSNAPSLGPAVASSGPVNNQQWTSIDVTQLVGAGGLVSLAITSQEPSPLTLASREAGSSEAPRLDVETTVASPPANTTPPSISGEPIDGATLSAAAGAWTGTAPISFAYEWRRCDSSGANCTAISGVTGSSYVVSSADVGATLRVAVTGSNTAGQATAISSATVVVTAPVSPDSTPPSAPSGLVVGAVTESSIALSWDASSDEVGVVGYDVFVDGSKVDTTGATSYTFSGLACGTTYTLAVDAYDAAGNRSSRASLSSATSPCPDTVAPTAPSNLTATATTLTSISLSWSASSDNVGVSGYDVFVNGGKIASTSAATYVFGALTCGTTYTLGVEAYDAARNHSTRATLGAATSACSSVVGTSDEVHYTFTGPSSVAFDWRGTATDIRYGATTSYGSSATTHTPSPLPFSSAGPFQEVELTGLTPGATYHYSIGGGADQTMTMAPTGGFRFDVEADVGDSGTYANVRVTQQQIAADSPAFVLVAGDLSYGNAHGQAAVDQHFNDVMAWSQQAAYMPAWGNHEWDTSSTDDLRNYKGRFVVPHPQTSPTAPAPGCCGEDWGWFDAGGVRFISYPEPYPGGTWSDWQSKADAIFAAAQADSSIHFIVTYGHRPAYSTGHHPGDATLAGILNTFGDRYSKYVLNLNGHSHDYERFQPIHGVTHITAAGGGASLETPWTSTDSRTAFRAMHLEHLRVDVSDTGMRIEALCGPASSSDDMTCVQGSVIDTYTIGT